MFLILLFLLSFPAWAEEERALFFNRPPHSQRAVPLSCVRVLLQVGAELQNGPYITPAMQQQAARLWQDYGTSAAGRVYEIYQTARLARVPASLREDAPFPFIEYGADNVEMIGANISGQILDDVQITVLVPARYRRTILDYQLQAHEWEHLLTRWDPLSPTVQNISNVSELLNMLSARIFAERLCIRAEWEWLQLVPENYRTQLATTLAADAALPRAEREGVIKALQDASKDFDAFYNAQAGWRCYNESCFVEKAIQFYRDARGRWIEAYRGYSPDYRRALQRRVLENPTFGEASRFRLQILLRELERDAG